MQLHTIPGHAKRQVSIALVAGWVAVVVAGGGCASKRPGTSADDQDTPTPDNHTIDGKGDDDGTSGGDDATVADTAPPDLASVTALAHTMVSVVFSEVVNASSVEAGAFHIQGGGSAVAVYEASLGGDGRTVTLTVAAGMQHGVTYTLLVQGVTDAHGNAIVGASKTFSGRGVVAAELTGAPVALTTVSELAVTVGGTDIVAYQSALVGPAHAGAWSGETSVASALVASSLVDGAYTLRVVGKDSNGNWQAYAEATTVQWVVDTLAPQASFTGTPPTLTSSSAARFVVGGDGVVAYKSLLDGGGWSDAVDVAAPIELSGLAEGTHTLAVIGRDQAGNWQAEGEAASYVWTVDPSASTALLTGLPAALTRVTSLEVAVGGNGVVTYIHSLDGGDWSATTATSELIAASNLADGAHTLAVIGSDAAGNAQSVPTTFSWAIDTQAPTATLTNTPADPTNVTGGEILVGGLDVVSYVFRVDGGAASGVYTTSETISLTGLGEGPHLLEVIGADAAGNWQTLATSHTWTIDTTPPTAVLSALPLLTNASSAHVAVSGTDVVAYKLQLDGGAWSAEQGVASAIALSGLGEGVHLLAVIGRDLAGNWQPIAAATTLGWTVDMTPPTATLNGLPPLLTGSRTLAVTVAGCVSYRVQLDDAPWSAATDVGVPITASDLDEGDHTLAVIGVDSAGNWQVAATVYSWTIDTTAPSGVVLLDTPSDPSNDATPSIIVTGDGVVAYSYTLDGGAPSPFTTIATPMTLSVGEGAHTLAVLGKDAAGNVQPSPTTLTWSVDLTPPVASLSGVPPLLTNLDNVNIAVTGADFYSSRLDGGAYSPATGATSPITLSGLADGVHTLEVLGLDLAGNWQVAPTTVGWTVDRTAPMAPGVTDLAGSIAGLGVHSSDLSLTFSWANPADAAEVAVQVATDAAFTNIVFGGAQGASVGVAQSYDYVVDPDAGAVYFARVRVRDAAHNWSAFGAPSDGIAVVGDLSGKVQSSNLVNLGGATVALQRADGTAVASTTTSAAGTFSFANVAIGTSGYEVVVSASGYGNAHKSNISVAVGAANDIGIIYLVSSSASAGTIAGTVVDANAGAKITGATVRVVDWSGATASTVTSASSNGGFTTATLAPGTYTLLISKTGFFDLQVDNVIVDGNKTVGRQALCQVLAEPQVRVVLLWGSAPADLDLHVVGPTAKTVSVDGAPDNRFHVYWNNRKSFDENTGNYAAGADSTGASSTTSLVQDDTNAYGPEAINLFGHGSGYAKGVYTFTVHDYSNTNWYAAPITLRVYDSQGLVQEIPIPNGGGTNYYWRAFKIDIQGPSRAQRTITVSNTFAAAPNNSWNSKSALDW